MDLELPTDIEERLHALTQITNALKVDDDVSLPRCLYSITRITEDKFASKRFLNRLLWAEDELTSSQSLVEHERELIQKWTATAETENQGDGNAVIIERRREALAKKAKEYRRELEAVKAGMPDEPETTISDLIQQQEKNRVKEQELKTKKAKLQVFQGLPPNLERARQQLRTAQDEHMKLIQLRERLLGKMADSVI